MQDQCWSPIMIKSLGSGWRPRKARKFQVCGAGLWASCDSGPGWAAITVVLVLWFLRPHLGQTLPCTQSLFHALFLPVLTLEMNAAMSPLLAEWKHSGTFLSSHSPSARMAACEGGHSSRQRALGYHCLSHFLIGSLPCLCIWELWTAGVKVLMFICPFLLVSSAWQMSELSQCETFWIPQCASSILHVPSNTYGRWDARSGLRSMEEPDLPEEAITPTGWHLRYLTDVRF